MWVILCLAFQMKFLFMGVGADADLPWVAEIFLFPPVIYAFPFPKISIFEKPIFFFKKMDNFYRVFRMNNLSLVLEQLHVTKPFGIFYHGWPHLPKCSQT